MQVVAIVADAVELAAVVAGNATISYKYLDCDFECEQEHWNTMYLAGPFVSIAMVLAATLAILILALIVAGMIASIRDIIACVKERNARRAAEVNQAAPEYELNPV